MSGAYIDKVAGGRWQVCGELSFASVPGLMKRSAEVFESAGKGERLLRVDLAGVPRADSAGLALLICWVRQARKRDIRIEFCNVPEQMLKIADVSGLRSILPLTGSCR